MNDSTDTTSNARPVTYIRHSEKDKAGWETKEYMVLSPISVHYVDVRHVVHVTRMAEPWPYSCTSAK